MNLSDARRISEAVGSWLHLEFCCYRAGLLSENSLKAAVGAVLSSLPISKAGVRAHAEFAHEALGGSKRVDFALVFTNDKLPKNSAEIVIETKWANSDHCNSENILRDIFRLAAIKKAEPETKCIFLLAGHTTKLNEKLSEMPFHCGGSRNTGLGKGGSSGKAKKLTFDHSNLSHQACIRGFIHSWVNEGLFAPKSVECICHGAHPVQHYPKNTVDFQAIAWEVTNVSNEQLDIARWPIKVKKNKKK